MKLETRIRMRQDALAFVEANPGCLTIDIVRYVGGHTPSTWSFVRSLAQANQLERVPGRGKSLLHYIPGSKEAEAEKAEQAVRHWAEKADREAAEKAKAEKVHGIVRRWLAPTNEDSVRQHLGDRHGLPLRLAEGLAPTMAYETHEAIDHSVLGHEHTMGVKRRGRPRKQSERKGTL